MSILKNISNTFLTRILFFILQGLTSILVARVLGPEKQGVYSLLILIPMVAAIFTSMGLPVANTYFAARSSSDRKLLFLLSLFSPLIFGLLSFFIVANFDKMIAQVLFHSSDQELLFLLKIVPLAAVFILLTNNYNGLLLGLRNYFTYNVSTVALPISFLLLLFLFCIVFNVQLEGAIYARILSYLFAGIFAMYLCGRSVDLRSTRASGIGIFRNIFSYGSKSNLAEIASFLNYRVDMFLIGFFLNSEIVGYYAIAVLIAETIWFLPNSIQTVLFPEISSIDRERAIKVVIKAFQLTFVVSFVCIVILIFVDSALIKVVFGSRYMPAIGALRFLYPAIFAMSMGKILGTFAISTGRTDITMKTAFLSLGINVLSNIILIPKFGIKGAAISSSLSYSFIMLILIIWFLNTSSVKFMDLIIPRQGEMSTYVHRIKSFFKFV